jgi:geranylgeranylglycerol-phosphate geranylgeranyltransferase
MVAAFIASQNSFEFLTVIFAAFSASLVAAAGNIINDYFDIQIDKIAHPERPLVIGLITKHQAIIFYYVLNILALIISYFISLVVFGIVLSSILLLLFYSVSLKRFVLFGNYVIAWLTGMVFIFGGIVVGNVSGAIIPAIFAFLINFIREIVKDIQDIKGDLSSGVITFPARYGVEKAFWVILILSVFLILLTLHPFLFNYYNIEYFVIVMLIVNPLLVYFLKSIFNNYSTENLKRMSLILKLNMLFGLIAIYLGK